MRVVPLFLVLALAGCMGGTSLEDGVGSHDPTRSSPIDRDEDEDQMLQDEEEQIGNWTLIGCRFRPILMHIPQTVIAGHVPSHYHITPPYGLPGLASIVLHQYNCDAMVLENHTVVAPAALAYVSVSARPDGNSSNGARDFFYQLEMFVDNLTAARALRAEGMPYHHAKIEGQETGEDLLISISVSGQLVYRVEGHLSKLGAPEQLHLASHFHGASAEVEMQVAIAHDGGGLIPFSTILEAHHGVLSDAEFPRYAGVSFPGDANAVLEFIHT